jgi:hypothetical protein
MQQGTTLLTTTRIDSQAIMSQRLRNHLNAIDPSNLASCCQIGVQDPCRTIGAKCTCVLDRWDAELQDHILTTVTIQISHCSTSSVGWPAEVCYSIGIVEFCIFPYDGSSSNPARLSTLTLRFPAELREKRLVVELGIMSIVTLIRSASGVRSTRR